MEGKEAAMGLLFVAGVTIAYWSEAPGNPAMAALNVDSASASGRKSRAAAHTEGTANNGSAFAGLSANTMFYNLTIAFAMLIGRFIFVIPLLAVAGSLLTCLPSRAARSKAAQAM